MDPALVEYCVVVAAAGVVAAKWGVVAPLTAVAYDVAVFGLYSVFVQRH
jgi:hypothetical protein